MVWEAICALGKYMCLTPPKYFIFGHLKVKADQLTQGEGYGRAIDLSEGQGHRPYGIKWIFEGQGWSSDHPCLINCLFHSDLKICWSNIKSVAFWLTFYIFQN